MACKKYQILKGPNFAGLPGESTQEPIQLLNNICEEAREEKKELWILFQDTAKAFDTVNLEMLRKALSRICLPNKAIDLIISLFQDREFKVIIDEGLTDSVIAGDGIDQGETISPLLWRIFYDPLLCKIQGNQTFGYKMRCSWKPNMLEEGEQQIENRTAAITYMDDTTWIASSKQNLQEILNEAREFYQANDSQINSTKSVLLNINSAEKQEQENFVLAGLDREKVQRMKAGETTRFLGIWIGQEKPQKDTTKRLQHEINRITAALVTKKMTDKQTIYVLNRVLIPRIEY
jgi:hypothetical protein